VTRGVVHETGGGVYRVVTEGGRAVDASLRGRLKQEARTGDKVVVGDEVRVAESGDGESWVIEEVLPRRCSIVRRSGPGRRAKAVAANLDRLVVVAAVREPDPRAEVVDRLLVLAEADGIPAVLVLNKVELPGGRAVADELAGVYRAAGYPVVVTSAVTGEGIEELRTLLCQGTSALVGPSGVGKSSLLNAVEPDLDLRTGALSRKVGRGRHTTVSARLIPLGCGGLVADTPGFAEVGVWGVEPETMDVCFPEFRELRSACRFRGCSHLHEPGCAVRSAVAEGRIPAERHRVYALLRAEAEADRTRRT
jgi:ribosome biogenesis GTPase